MQKETGKSSRKGTKKERMEGKMTRKGYAKSRSKKTEVTIPGFSEQGNWYKGNLHSHTVNSDGKLLPVEAVALYKRHGYSFLCFSEHDLYTDYRKSFDCEDFIILPGLEASAVLMEGETRRRLKVHHIHGILGTKEMQEKAGNEGRLFAHMEPLPPMVFTDNWDGEAVAQKLADTLAGRGCFTTYNHPVWSRVRASEFTGVKGLWAMEIFNYNTVNESNTGFDTTHWDVMLREGTPIFGFASDDNHNEGLFDDACGGYVMVKSGELSHEAIVSNLLAGNFYSSTGPKIWDWGIRDGIAYVECSPVSRISFIAGGYVNDGTSIMSAGGDSCETGKYQLKGHETYLRVECTDRYGQTAWSNPICLGPKNDMV